MRLCRRLVEFRRLGPSEHGDPAAAPKPRHSILLNSSNVMSSKWQYRVKFIKVPRTEATAIVSGELNELGADGWELVNVVEVGTILMAVFKRPAAN